jgi:hypothetical protein
MDPAPFSITKDLLPDLDLTPDEWYEEEEDHDDRTKPVFSETKVEWFEDPALNKAVSEYTPMWLQARKQLPSYGDFKKQFDVTECMDVLKREQPQMLRILNVSGKVDYTKNIVIAEASTVRQLRAMADNLLYYVSFSIESLEWFEA